MEGLVKSVADSVTYILHIYIIVPLRVTATTLKFCEARRQAPRYLLETVALGARSMESRGNPLLVHTARSISLSEGAKGEPDCFQLVAQVVLERL